MRSLHWDELNPYSVPPNQPYLWDDPNYVAFGDLTHVHPVTHFSDPVFPANGFQGTELILSSTERNSTAGVTNAQADAFLDKLDVLLCAGRMSAPTRQALKSLLTTSTTAADNAILMKPADPHRRERAAVEMLLMLPEAVVIR